MIDTYRGRIDDSRSCDTDKRIDVGATVKIGHEERAMQVARCNNNASLCVHLVDVVLRGRNVHVLYPVAASIDKRQGEDLLWHVLSIDTVVSGKKSLEEQAELRAPNDGWIHVMIRLVAGSVIGATPCDGVGLSKSMYCRQRRKPYCQHTEYQGNSCQSP